MLRSKGLMAMALAAFCFGFAFAGGADCHKKDGATAAHAGEKGAHCHLGMTKNIVKTAQKTDNGAVVTFTGKTDEAVEFIKAHLSKHEAAANDCPECPMTMEGVTTSVKMTDQGGKVTLVGSDEKTIKRVQKWAVQPAACCEKEKATKA
jgi:hypothetical protein